MAETVVIPGGLFSIAIPEGDQTTPGEEINHINMALARGFLLTWDYGERIHRHTGLVEQDLIELAEMKADLDIAVGWEDEDFTAGTAAQNNAAKSDLLLMLNKYGIGNDKSAFLLDGGGVADAVVTVPRGDYTMDWPPDTTDNWSNPIGPWPPTVIGNFVQDELYVTSDGVYFTMMDTTGFGNYGFVQVDLETDVVLQVPAGEVFSNNDLAEYRRALELAIESKTQIGQNKQAFLQDLVGNLQKWLTFVTSLLDKKKRDCEGIAANFK